MKKIYLKDFIKTGDFGPVKIGMKKQHVINLLGEPDSDNDFGSGTFGLLYSWYEFFFDKKTQALKSIQNDHLQANCSEHDEMILFKNDKFEIDTWFLKINHDITYKEVKEILKRENISFSEEKYWDNDIIKFESGVFLDFDDRDDIWEIYEDGTTKKDESLIINNKENFVLNGIRYFPEYD
ncbi:hypothetical protein [uncultured Tenacibaculum sp.]|uniref:hypothetical protein n=1 Tax=uncultured Tenacibaculum sp. TaxID=174713 RepID=UPI0026350863|nr:hypothetical protein [uncultured Tenacibaculum sp.]